MIKTCPDCQRNVPKDAASCVCGFEFPKTQAIIAVRCGDCKGGGVVVAIHVESERRAAFRCQCGAGQRYPQWHEGRKWLTYNVLAREKGWVKEGDYVPKTPGSQGKS